MHKKKETADARPYSPRTSAKMRILRGEYNVRLISFGGVRFATLHHPGPTKRDGPFFDPAGDRNPKAQNAQDLFGSRISRSAIPSSCEKSLRFQEEAGERERGRRTHHADKHPTLLRDAPHAGVADNADREPGRETGQPDREAGTELDKAGVERHGRFEAARDEDRDDEAVDLCARIGVSEYASVRRGEERRGDGSRQ